jgi:flavin reductase (DIM6/NTAB) family NADH-FMN oxidoreductase RutF
MKENTAWDLNIDRLREALDGDGAFLVARDETGKPNPMTIGWAQVGHIWNRPTVSVLVRRSRYTYGCLLHSDDFTVSVPAPGKLTEQLAFCGSRSGRDMDKAQACALPLEHSRAVDTPVVGSCPLRYECRILMRKQLAREDFKSAEVLETYYRDDDHHMIVIGEIVAVY